MNRMQPTRIDACLSTLVESILNDARELLSRGRHFYPIAAVIAADGQLRSVDADDGSYELPAPAAAIDALVRRLQHDAASGSISAAATCVDSATVSSYRGEPPSIRVLAEHASGASVQVDVRYRFRWWRGLEFEPLLVVAVAPRIFTRPPNRPIN